MSHSPRSNSSSNGSHDSNRPVYAHVEDSAAFTAPQMPRPTQPSSQATPSSQASTDPGQALQKRKKSRRGLFSLLVVIVIAVSVGTWWLRNAEVGQHTPGSALSSQWLNGPEAVERLDGAATVLFAGDRYAVMHWDGLPQLWDMNKVAPVLEELDYKERKRSVDEDDGEGFLSFGTIGSPLPEGSRFTEVGDEALLDTNLNAGAVYDLSPPGWFSSKAEWKASSDFIKATSDETLQWHGAIAHTPIDGGQNEVDIFNFDPETTELRARCTIALTQSDLFGEHKPTLTFNAGIESALLSDTNGLLRIVDLTDCDEPGFDFSSMDGLRLYPDVNNAARLTHKIQRIIPIDTGWWLSVFDQNTDSFRSLYLSANGTFTYGYTFDLDTAMNVRQGQEFTKTDLDRAYRSIEPGDKGLFLQKVGDRLQISVEGAGGVHREYLDRARVPWLDEKAIYISDFDHALVVGDDGVELIGKDEPSHLWRIRGQKAYFAGGTLIVIDEQLGKTTFYRPGS